eukprot:PITA_02848
MQWMGMKPDEFTLASIVSACASMVDLGYGRKIHGPVVKLGFESSVFVGTSLVDMICPKWASGRGHKVFNQIDQTGMKPNELTFVNVFNACAILINLRFGRQVHAYIVRSGLQSQVSVCNVIVTIYAKTQTIEYALCMFDKMQERDLISWNAIIAGYAHNGHYQEALKLIFQIKRIGVTVNQFTYASILSVSSSLPAFEEGKQLHDHIIQTGFDSNMFVGSALVDMYAKYGSLQYARQVLDKMPEQYVISCNAMIAGYVQHGYSEEALKLFCQMQHTGLKPDEATFASIVSACANLAVLEHGRHIHAHIFCTGFELPMSVVNTLVTMYAECGGIKDARKVFEKMIECDVVSWNAMIVGHAQHGDGMETLRLFEQMLLTGIRPDAITFLDVLSACSHTGLLDRGHYYFHSMRHEHNITPRMDHHPCMIALLGRVGRLDKAEDFINKMPFEPDVNILVAPLSSCRVHSNIEIGKCVAQLLFDLEPQNTSAYVLLSNIYFVAGKWDDRAKVRKLMKDKDARKKPWFS